MKALKVTTSNEIAAIDLDQPLYKSIASLIGGFEIVRPRGLKRPFVMIVDDEFLYKDKARNYIGSALYGTQQHGHPIDGDIVIMREEPGFDGYELVALTESDIVELTSAFQEIIKYSKR